MKSNIQYTIRNIPEPVDQIIRKRAKRTGKSFNTTVVDLLKKQTIGENTDQPDIFQRLRGADTLDNSFFEAMEDQSRVDESLWR